ncbi:Gfo/Idh/MocA family oxidoreductase [Paenibacillus rhizovicinus]|uniref:Gfo/Idh/MocA family oxidoreductase n=1 Tax=Paenibacillus rhizovicinus TaxID=2704463 RepID=A0A6C0P2P3_9BACL|nr:Gfo/Idh/MocA family oxidoreductase [Paenibacillus rhizovicinus]QHW32747.1 Gfo/Idh/MocA family oxidoreductase [Paenibacillus rhizovicinus]
MTKLRIGMISYEHVHADFRSKALREMENVEIVAVADDDPARGAAAANRYGGQYYGDYRELLARKDIDFVFIHSANADHLSMVLDTVSAGKNLFCEKPIATSAADALAMTLAVERAGLRGTVGFCSRFIPEAERAKEVIDSGLIGRIISARAVIGLAGIQEIGCPDYMTDWMVDPVRGGGGAFIDEGAHAIDLLRWYAGDIAAVSTLTANNAKPQLMVEDNAATVLQFASGALGTLNTLWSLHIDVGMRNTLEIYGTEGTISLELTSKHPKLQVYSEFLGGSANGSWFEPHIKPKEAEPHDYQSWPTHAQHYKREVTDIINCLRQDRPFRAGFRDGLHVAQVTEAGYSSAKEGRTIRID